MYQLHAGGWNVADGLLTGLANIGFWLTPGTRVLHLGCGSGEVVYRLRHLGFEAFGFDLEDRVSYRNPEDRRYFQFSGPARAADGWDRVRIGYDDAMFDVAVSISLIESVSELNSLMGELARLLVPDGIAVHLYTPAEDLDKTPIWLRPVRRLIGRKSPRSGQTNRVAPFGDGAVRRYTREQLVAICASYFKYIEFEEERYYINAEAGKLIRQDPRNANLNLDRTARSFPETAVLRTGGTLAGHLSRADIPSDAYELWESTRVILKPPFVHRTGHAYTADVPELGALSDTLERPDRSPYHLFEDGRQIGAPHKAHAEVVLFGRGRFSHWNDTFYFSSSDETDPNANGREYAIARPPNG